MLSLLGFVHGTLIATFASHTPPPGACRPFKMNSGIKYDVWVAPTRHADCCTIAYSSETDSTIHYLRYTTNNELMRCIWTTPMTLAGRAIVFSEVKEWYYNLSNNNLTSNLTNVEDAVAWAAA